jgi:intracellular sulfur oxidation DsrE/DsrF family protein
LNTRKEFLIGSSLLAVAPAIAQAAPPHAKPKAPKEPELRFDFDEARFNQILAKPAKHKQCFGVTKVEDGVVLMSMANTINAYEQYLHEAPGSVHTLAVLYHGAAIALAMNDSVWNTVLLPALKSAPPSIKTQFAGAKAGKGNPYAKDFAGVVARGSSFFVCHNAIAGFAGLAADALKEPPKKVHDAIMAGILPGALVVPAGVMAINAAQEAKFTYIQSSV